ncbi:MAG: hypothetical protein QXN59_02555 [Candidatus Micrarchaeaceae archaeon]
MLGIKVQNQDARNAILVLRSNGLLPETFAKHSASYTYFFVKNCDEKVKKLLLEAGCAISDTKMPHDAKPVFGKHAKTIGKGYEALGNIAIIDSQDGGGEELALRILAANKHITTVVSKAGAVEGEYRLRKFRYVAGKKTFVADCVENGCRFVFDIRKTFFSGKLSYERSRICSLAKDNEKVIVMFAGVGPFAIEIAKAHKGSDVVAVELNRNAYNYMVGNIALNKTCNVKAVCGDAKKACSKYVGWADRIVMPLPKGALGFLDVALRSAAKGCIVHIYSFGERDSAFEEAKNTINSAAEGLGMKCRILFQRKVRDYSAKEIEIVTDFMVIK